MVLTALNPYSYLDWLNIYSLDELKKIAAVLKKIVKNSADSDLQHILLEAQALDLNKKFEIACWIEKCLFLPPALQLVYSSLSWIDRTAVQEAVHDPFGDFDLAAFKIKYGTEPNFSMDESSKRGSVGPLRIFLPSRNCIAADLRERLARFVPKPKKCMVAIADFQTWSLSLKSSESSQFNPSELVQHMTYEAALHDSMAILRLVGKQEIRGTLTRISSEDLDALWNCLLEGDFYPRGLECSFSIEVKIGPMGIKPFAWMMLLSAGNLIKCSGGKFVLTARGEAVLASQAKHPDSEQILRSLWQSWLDYASFNELHRVELIKGQKSTPRPLLSPTPARMALKNALAEIPVGQWVPLEEFFRYLIANRYDFEVSRDVWSLYLEGNPDAISLGHSHFGWNHLNGRFARAFLLEYAATLGIIDVILCSPWHSEEEISEICGLNHLVCMSRYDGLKYLRVTPFGSTILNEAEKERRFCAP